MASLLDSRRPGDDAAKRQEQASSLDLPSFLNAVHNQISDLHITIKSSHDGHVEKAFQRVPRSMRRRTASHNARRLPRRLRNQARRGQAADKTPSVAEGLAKRKISRPASAWVYENTKKRIRLQQEQKLAAQNDDENGNLEADGGGVDTEPGDGDNDDNDDNTGLGDHATAAVPRLPLPIDNLRLPTHQWHAKRAHMDNPGFLWNTIVAKTPANKTYRMSLRASGLKPGMCICWDTSYKATIYLKGTSAQLCGALASVVEPHLLTPSLTKGGCCVDAKLPRSFGYQQHSQASTGRGAALGELGGPGNCGAVTLFFNPTTGDAAAADVPREVFLRLHPAVFSHVWTVLNRTIAHDNLDVRIRDFRLEVGSIEVTGSEAARTMASTIYPYATDGSSMGAIGKEFLKLRTIDVGALPLGSGAMLAFDIQDPRLDEPAGSGTTAASATEMVFGAAPGARSHSMLQAWPDTKERRPSGLFHTMLRHAASKQVPQSVLDKRRGKLAHGEKLLANHNCKPIPVIFAAAGSSSIPASADPRASSNSSSDSQTWILLAPRSCIDKIWLCLHVQCLSSGMRPMCAGLDEEHHMALERGRPWFPPDFPGTPTGWDWELQSRKAHEKEWAAKPTAKRTQWAAVDLGNGTRGEIGSGFACDWECLFGVDAVPATLSIEASDEGISADLADGDQRDSNGKDASGMEIEGDDDDDDSDEFEEDVQFEALRPGRTMPDLVRHMQHATWNDVRAAVQATRLQTPPVLRTPYQLLTISVQLIWGGVPDARARIYRLPDDETMRKAWLAVAGPPARPQTSAHALRRMPEGADVDTRTRLLARSLLETPLPYPRPHLPSAAGSHLPIPERNDLIGFVTSGAHRFQTGKGFGIGHVGVQKLVEAIVAADGKMQRAGAAGAAGTAMGEASKHVPIHRDGRFCIVRNVGERVGRLARWTPISH